jgi:sugar phosphate isomerase/epimerase
LAGLAAASAAWAAKPLEERVCVFTDHLDGDDGYSWEEVAKLLRQIGAAGPDLTVREGGLVRPERAKEDLPKAVKVFRDHGLDVPMLTTNITAAEHARPILETAVKLGIPYYKFGYTRYDDVARWRETRDGVQKNLAGLAALNRELNIHAGYHQHSGPMVGGLTWDALELLEPFDKNWIGLFCDPAHAVIEGGNFGWKYSIQRALDKIVMLAMKDFVWEKTDGKWRTRWVPLGQGMVPIDEALQLISKVSFAGPVSLHMEYDIPGRTKAERFQNSLEATERDIRFLKSKLRALKGRS